jgi:phosphoribosylformylglycinamidine synthase
MVRAARGCHDAAIAFQVPFISGKDSLFNEYRLADGSSHPIPGTLLISAIGIVPDIRRTLSMHLKRPGNLLYMVGLTGDDLGGSLALRLRDQRVGAPPIVRLGSARRTLSAVHRAIRSGLVQACHDPSEGGLAVAVAEMAIASGFGAELDLQALPVADEEISDAALLFAETPTRFLIEVAPDDEDAFRKALGRVPHALVGRVTDNALLRVAGAGGTLIEASVADLKVRWQAPLAEVAG